MLSCQPNWGAKYESQVRRMQTYAGVLKVAAMRLNMIYEDYLANRAAGLKWCSLGQHWAPIADFGRNALLYTGLQSSCREHAGGRGRGPSRLEKEKKLKEGLRWCGGCKQWLPIEGTKWGKFRCRLCINAADRLRYATDERYRKERRQHQVAHRRATAAITPEVQDAAMALTNGKCMYCDASATTFDHVIPVSKGGTADISNIVPACVSCNSSKGNRDLDVWLARRKK